MQNLDARVNVVFIEKNRKKKEKRRFGTKSRLDKSHFKNRMQIILCQTQCKCEMNNGIGGKFLLYSRF